MPQCPICKEETKADSVFCGKCGAKLDAEAEGSASSTMRDIAQELDRAIRENPNNTDARYQLAVALMYDNQWGPAAKHLVEVVRLDPEFADAHANLAICLAKVGQVDRATEAIGDALALTPGSERFQRLQAQIDVMRASDQ